MELADLPVRDPRPAITAERDDLVALLAGLTDGEWVVPTEAGHWRVKDVALHLLDNELGWLSRERDRDLSGLLPTDVVHDEFVRSLDAKNERWVAGAQGLSRRVVVELIDRVGRDVDAFVGTIDLAGPSHVVWASTGPVPRWFDLCRDLTERWVHQRQIRDAVGRPGAHDRFLPDVLRTFVWGFPHQVRSEAPQGTVVEVALGGAGRWHLVRTGDRWVLEPGPGDRPAARLDLPASVAWRQLTGLPVPAGEVRADGPRHLVAPLLEVRGIIV